MTCEELKAARREMGLTQAQLADVLDTPLRTVHGWEAGRSIPGVAGVAVRLMLQASPVVPGTPAR